MPDLFEKWQHGSAELDSSGAHRYWLTRFTPDSLFKTKTVAFCLLNPSIANAEVWDATLRKGVGFAERWKFNRLVFVNLCSYRSTDPKSMVKRFKKDEDATTGGMKNIAALIRAASESELLVCAWGRNASNLGDVAMTATAVLRAARGSLSCLGQCNNGMPMHILMLPYSTKLRKFK